MTEVYRYEVPIDDQWHTLDLTGPVLHVGQREAELHQAARLAVWALHIDQQPAGLKVEPKPRTFRVFGTGQPLTTQDNAAYTVEHVATVIGADGYLVWHLFEQIEHARAVAKAFIGL